MTRVRAGEGEAPRGPGSLRRRRRTKQWEASDDMLESVEEGDDPVYRSAMILVRDDPVGPR